MAEGDIPLEWFIFDMLHMKLRVSEALLKQLLKCALREHVGDSIADRKSFISDFEKYVMKAVTRSTDGAWKIKLSADGQSVEKVKFVDGKIAKRIIGKFMYVCGLRS